MAELKVIHYDDVTVEEFPGGAHYRKLIAGESDEMAVVTGIQVSPPGYATPDHSHPYVEIVTVLEGEAEAWLETVQKRLIWVLAGQWYSLPKPATDSEWWEKSL